MVIRQVEAGDLRAETNCCSVIRSRAASLSATSFCRCSRLCRLASLMPIAPGPGDRAHVGHAGVLDPLATLLVSRAPPTRAHGDEARRHRRSARIWQPLHVHEMKTSLGDRLLQQVLYFFQPVHTAQPLAVARTMEPCQRTFQDFWVTSPRPGRDLWSTDGERAVARRYGGHACQRR